MNPIKPDPNNSPDAAARKVENLARAKEPSNEQESWLRTVLQNASDMITVLEPDRTIRYVNSAAERILGYRPEQLIGTCAFDYVHPDDIKHLADSFAEALAKPGVLPAIEFRLRTTNGSWRHVEVIRNNQLNDPAVKGIVTITRDVTERKSSEERLKAQYNGFPIPTFSWQRVQDDFELVDFNEAADRITLGRLRSSLGVRASEWYSDSPQILGMLRRCFSEGTTIQDEIQWRMVTTGEDKHFAITFAYVPPDSVILHAEDITERKQAEEEVRFQVKLLDTVGQSIIVTDPQGKVIYWNQAAEELYGWSAEEVIGLSIMEVTPSEEMVEKAAEIMAEILAGKSWWGEFEVRRKDGTTFPAMVTDTPVYDERGDLVGIIGISTDISEIKQTEKLRRSEERFRLLAENAQDLIALYRIKPTPGFEYVSPSSTAITGYTPEEYYADPELGYKIVHPDDRHLLDEILHYPKASSTIRWIRKDGKVVWTEQRNKPIYDEAGELVAIEGIARDITERKEAEEALRSSEEFFRALYENAQHPIFLLDRDLNFVDVNPYACEFYGYTREEFTRINVSDITLPEERADQLRTRERLHKQGSVFIRERRHRKKNGEIVAVTADVARVTRSGKELYVSKLTDITERKRAEEQLEYQAFHDLLTGLPNRYLLLDRLGQALKRTRRTKGRKVAILFMDLDNFKAINDSLGHEVGDRLLIAVTRRLGGCLRPEDTLVRFGGDEFAILLEHVGGPEDAVRVVERITKELRGPFVLDGRELFVRISIGVAVGEAPTKSAEDLIRDADTAMYRAKEEGSDYRIFDPGMYFQAMSRLELENDIRRAIEAEEFALHYQPIVNLRSGEVSRVEALVRWNHPERGLLNPLEFLTVVEESGLIIPMGEQMLEEACRQAKEWQEEHAGIEPMVMSVNLSAKQLRRPGLATTVREVLRSTGLQAECLSLDITETVYIKVLEGNTGALGELKKLGVKISIDDFGVGYSSLAYLKRLPADVLKIDKSFVKGLGEDVEDTAIVGMIIELAHTLGMAVIAEGVESEGQAALLEEMGCDMAQGFYFAEPLSPGEASGFLSEERLAVRDEQSGNNRGNESALPDELER